MTISDPKLQAHVQRVKSVINIPLNDDQGTVCGLLDACQFFSITEGDRSPRAREALEILISQELRPAVRAWFRRAGENVNPAARKFRQELSILAGEEFGE